MSDLFKSIGDPDPNASTWDHYPAWAWKCDSRAVIAMAPGQAAGCILYAAGPAVRSMMVEVSPILDDIGLDDAPEGITVWEGRIHSWQDSDGEYESELKGKFRPPTEQEWQAIRQGACPWDDQDWRHRKEISK